MQILYKIGADLAVLVHFLWILFLIFGAVIGRRRRLFMWLHLAALGFSVGLQTFSGICPLTYLEVWLRERHDPQLAYPGSFIAHYAEELVYLRIDSALVFWLTLGIVFISLLIYWRSLAGGARK